MLRQYLCCIDLNSQHGIDRRNYSTLKNVVPSRSFYHARTRPQCSISYGRACFNSSPYVEYMPTPAVVRASSTQAGDHVVREVRELVRLTRKYGMPGSGPYHTFNTVNQLTQQMCMRVRMAKLQKFVSPDPRRRSYYPVSIISAFRQSNVVLRNILAADAGARKSRWTEEEREEFAQLIRFTDLLLNLSFVLVACIECSGSAFMGYWMLGKLGVF